MAKDMDGNDLRVGDSVGFKDDVEQYGKVKRITGEMVTLGVWDSVEGCEKQRNLPCSRLWKE
jgi:hypothetical protein